MTLFVDPSFLIALFHEKDDFHLQAEKIAKKLKEASVRFLITNIVIAETVNLIFRLKGPKAAKNLLELIDKSGVETVFITNEIFTQGYNLLFSQKTKRGLNFFDCLHLATMKSLGINTILSFDKSFKKEVKVIG